MDTKEETMSYGYVRFGRNKLPAYRLSNGEVWRNTTTNKTGDWIKVINPSAAKRFIRTEGI